MSRSLIFMALLAGSVISYFTGSGMLAVCEFAAGGACALWLHWMAEEA